MTSSTAAPAPGATTVVATVPGADGAETVAPPAPPAPGAETPPCGAGVGTDVYRTTSSADAASIRAYTSSHGSYSWHIPPEQPLSDSS